MQTKQQSGILIQHLECYALDSVRSFTFYNQAQTYLTLSSSHTTVAFKISSQENYKAIQDSNSQSIKPFKTLSTQQIQHQVLKSYITNQITVFLSSNHQCILQHKQIYENVHDVLLIDHCVLLVIWKHQKPMKIIILGFKKTEGQQASYSNQLEQLHTQQFPKTDKVHYCDSQSIVTTQYIVKIKNTSQLIMLPNPTYDGTSDKDVLVSVDNRYLYCQGQTYYFHSANVYSIEETQSDHITKLPIQSRISSKLLCFSLLFKLLFTIQPVKKNELELKNPFSLNLYSIQTGIVIFSYPLKLKNAQFVQSVSKNEEIIILDLEGIQLLSLKIPCLIFSNSSDNLQQEKSVHANTMKGLEIRKKQLLSYRKYAQKQQLESMIKILLNQQNKAFLFDGVRMLFQSFQIRQKQQQLNDQSKNDILIRLIKICKTLVESKYESHIQGSLQILVSVSRRKGDGAGVRNCLKQVLSMKRIQKMIKQSKKKRLFELAYELGNNTLGPDFIFKLN